MSYVEAIKTAIIVFPIIAFLITVPFILYNYHKYGSIHYLKTIIIYSFILYLITIYFLVILPLPSFEAASKIPGPHYNFMPFNFVKDFITETSLVLSKPSTYLLAIKEPCFYIVIFNIFMTIPFGMYLRYYFKCSFKKTLIYSFLLSFFFELTQGTALYFIYPNPYRLCDIDDLILNTMGGILGYFLMGLFKNILPSRDRIDKEALEIGKEVSGLRRITIFGLDLFIYLVISSFIYILTSYKYTYLLLFIIYYIIKPLLNNATIGMKFLNVQMVSKPHLFFKNLFRNLFLTVYYIILPIFLIYSAAIISRIYNLSAHIQILIYLMILIFIFLFDVVHILIILMKRKIYYDKLFSFELVSTISENFETKIK